MVQDRSWGWERDRYWDPQDRRWRRDTPAARRLYEQERRDALGWFVVDDPDSGPTIDPNRFRPAGDQWAGGWRAEAAPRSWGPETAALNAETRALLAAALTRLPQRQRVVVELRDVHGLSADEVCGVLALSPANQRVLLHRARVRLRECLQSGWFDAHPAASR